MRGETAPFAAMVDPVGEDRRLKRAANDVAQTDAGAMCFEGVEVVIANRIERREKLSVRDVEVEDGLRVRILE